MSREIDQSLIIKATRSLDDLLSLLVDGLGWPLPESLESIPLLPWTPEELGLDAGKLGRLTGLHQVPKLTSRQPFGVFVLTFDGGQLPIGALRRVVSQLVRRKRRVTTAAAASQWDLGDLVFFCHNGEGHGSVHVVAVNSEDERQVLKTISWTSRPTPARINLLSKFALADLSWPDDDVAINDWRAQWNHAFSAGYREGVRSAAALSQRMAEVATEIREEITALLRVETDTGPLHSLLTEMRQRLDAGVDEGNFGDIFAQTLVYGLLTARISHPEHFKAAGGKALLDFENPFLDAIYGIFRQQANDSLDLDHLGLTDLALTLAATDIDALLADFGANERRDDPVIYLYEEFLDKYDKNQRQRLGAYYTPIPLVDAIIGVTDWAIRNHWGLKDGISSTQTWNEWMKSHPETQSKDIPDGSKPVVSMLDPATGTGTFLLQWLRRIKKSGQRDVDAILDSINAFEISLASYAVAHLKTGLELPADVRANHRLPIYLTDTLASIRPGQIEGLEDPISQEALLAQRVKQDDISSVIMGNPPYARMARGEGGGWVLHPADGEPDLFTEIMAPAVEHTIFSYTSNLYNLYVYFWRWAIWKAFEQRLSTPAVLTFITPSSWLNGPGFLGLRRLAREVADEIRVVDLQGNNRGGLRDENVFGIETPVAIVSLVRAGPSDRKTPAKVFYTKLSGTREEKLNQLGAFSVEATPWQLLESDWLDPLAPSGELAWIQHPLVTDLFPWQQPGCKFGRTWPIAPHPDLLKQRWRRFLSTDDPSDRATCFYTGSSGRNIHTAVGGFKKLADEAVGAGSRPITPYGYRSFDRQWCFDDPRLAKTDSPSLWASVSERQLFFVVPGKNVISSGPAAVLSVGVPDLDSYFGNQGGKDVIPMLRDGLGTPNIDPVTLSKIGEMMGVSELSAEDLFFYAYAILGASDYTSRFAEHLTTPGLRIPVTLEQELFARVVEHGKKTIALQTEGARFPEFEMAVQANESHWHPEPSRALVDTKDYWYDAESQTLNVGNGRLNGVSQEAWDFNVSGMQVIKKWLGYRTAKGTGRSTSSTSPLDAIRPTVWYPEWSGELVSLVSKLQGTLKLMELGADLLNQVLEGEVISASELPEPRKTYRSPPSGARNPYSDSVLF